MVKNRVIRDASIHTLSYLKPILIEMRLWNSFIANSFVQNTQTKNLKLSHFYLSCFPILEIFEL